MASSLLVEGDRRRLFPSKPDRSSLLHSSSPGSIGGNDEVDNISNFLVETLTDLRNKDELDANDSDEDEAVVADDTGAEQALLICFGRSWLRLAVVL